jgi:type 1 glutamine amidotransferase
MMRIDCVLVAGGKWHDIDFARLELLKLLAEDECVRVRVFEDYANIDALHAARFIVTYTCDVVPDLTAQEALRAWLVRGGRLVALHGSNTILRHLGGQLGSHSDPLKFDTPGLAPHFNATLGSVFLSHPPYGRFRVEVADPSHPLVAGLDAFETVDEQYLLELNGEPQVLLHARFGGKAAPQFPRQDFADAWYPVLYLKPWGRGGVLYNTLGHCRGRYDMAPLADIMPDVQRGSWDQPVFYELLRRSIAWAKAGPV